MAQLNIKDAETHSLANRLARARQTSAAAAVKSALREAIERDGLSASDDDAVQQERIRKIEKILEGSRELFKPEFRDQELSLTHGDLLYDEFGLPK